MAEAVVTLVSNEIKPLRDLIVQEAKFLCGVGYQVELAQDELHLMGAFLKDADSRAGDDEVVRNWVKLIRDAAYDLEDVIESFSLRVVSWRRRGCLKRFVCIFSEGVVRHRIGSEIQDIMNKFSSLRSSLQSYNIRQSDPERASASKIQKQRDQRQTYAHEIEAHLVGLEESTKVLVDELLREEKCTVLCLFGGWEDPEKPLLQNRFLFTRMSSVILHVSPGYVYLNHVMEELL